MSDQILRKELVNLLVKKQANLNFEDAVKDFPESHINTFPEGCPYSFWHVLEHLRICQRDILDYITSDDYHWPNFPDDLWPIKDAGTDLAGWQQTVNAFLTDQQSLVDIVRHSKTDLFAPLKNSGEHKHSILREINIIAEHNAYHTGAFVIMRQSLSIWP